MGLSPEGWYLSERPGGANISGPVSTLRLPRLGSVPAIMGAESQLAACQPYNP